MEKLRGLVDAGQINRQVLEETSSTGEALTWLKEHGLPEKQCACEKGNPCGCKEGVVDTLDNLPRFYQ